jgi:hypothetical protein
MMMGEMYRKADVLPVADDFEFLPSIPIGRRPKLIILLGDLGLPHHPGQLFHHNATGAHLLLDHRVPPVVRVVGVAQLAVRLEFKLQELVPKSSLVADTTYRVIYDAKANQKLVY